MNITQLNAVIIITICLHSCAKKLTEPTKPNTQAGIAIVSPIQYANNKPSIPINKPMPIAAIPPVQVILDTLKSSQIISNVPNIIEGGILLKTKCAACHDAKEPTEYNADQWDKIVNWMAPRAGLTAKQKIDLAAYLSSFAKKVGQ